MTTNYREILRLLSRGLSQRDIATSCKCSRNTVARVLAQAREKSLAWPFPADLMEGDLGKMLFPESTDLSSSRQLPDLEYIHREMAKS